MRPAALGIAALLTLLLAATPAAAKPDLIVNNTNGDGDGDCLPPDDCSLHDAIDAANLGLGKSIGFDPAVFPPGVDTTILLLTALPPIVGSNRTVDGTGSSVVIDLLSCFAPDDGLVFHSPNAPLSNITVRNLTVKDSPALGIAVCGGDIGGDCDQNVSKVTIEGVKVIRADIRGIEILGDDVAGVTIADSVVYGSGSFALNVFADGALNAITIQRSIGRDSNTGIRLRAGTATKIKLLENTVRDNVSNGILLFTNGDATSINIVENTATGNGNRGVQVDSDGSISKLSASDNVSSNNVYGIQVDAKDDLQSSKIERNTTSGNSPLWGIVVSAGGSISKVKVARNVTSLNGADGIQVNATTADPLISIQIDQNTSTGNNGAGIDVIGSDDFSKKVRIQKNRTDSNTFEGIFANSGGLSIQSNTASANKVGIRIDFNGDDAVVKKNSALGNEESGISVDASATGVFLQGNTAIGNNHPANSDPALGADLEDESPACGSNVWKKNEFHSADPAVCIE